MAVYLITYDLSSPEKDYSSLFSEIENLGNAKRILKSVWLVAVEDKNAHQISETLRKVMDKDDLLYVVKNHESDRHGWIYSSIWKWLDNPSKKQYLSC
jgi:CRISPR/Cas system-associated endoribonuclease Cas2